MAELERRDLIEIGTPVGQLAELRDVEDLAKSRSYSYDGLRRLVLVAEGVPASAGGTPVPIEDYTYDAEGNRTASHLSLTHVHDVNPGARRGHAPAE